MRDVQDWSEGSGAGAAVCLEADTVATSGHMQRTKLQHLSICAQAGLPPLVAQVPPGMIQHTCVHCVQHLHAGCNGAGICQVFEPGGHWSSPQRRRLRRCASPDMQHTGNNLPHLKCSTLVKLG
jgi:hypothetical protein